MRSNIVSALELSSRFGWRVFPAKPADKSPYINGWQQRATADADEIERLFDLFPDAMIGLPPVDIGRLVCRFGWKHPQPLRNKNPHRRVISQSRLPS